MKHEDLKPIAGIFLRIGSVGFGGPLATISLMENEMVRKRNWISPARFTEIYAICKLLPGPLAPQVAISLGRDRAGSRGGFIAGFCFILPSFLLVCAIAAIYTKYSGTGGVAAARPLFHGFQIGALVLIAASILLLFRPYSKDRKNWAIALATAVLTFFAPAFEPIYILGFGALGAFLLAEESAPPAEISSAQSTEKKPNATRPNLHGFLPAFAIAPSFPLLGKLFWPCFKAGAFVFGTGIAIVPLLETDFVHRLAWLTHEEFMDALAIGQMTPGPFVITATFIGYKVAGWIGAITATVGIFLPSFVNGLYLVPRVWARFSRTRYAKGFVAFAVPAVVGCIAGASVRLSRATLVSPLDGVLALALFCSILRWKIPSWALIPATGIAYYAGTFLFTRS